MTKETSPISSFTVIITFVCLGIIGIALIPLLSIQLYPSAEPPALVVTYSWPDVSARVIEEEVTSKMEGLFASLKGIKNISSVSSKGYGRISLDFKKNVNRDALRFEIASLIRQCYPELPADVSYPLLSMNANGERASPLMTFAVNSAANSRYIGKYVENEIIPFLSRIKGVSEVQLYGATPYEMEVKFKMEQVQALGITGDDIATGINAYFKLNHIGKGSYQKPEINYTDNLSIQLRFSTTDTLAWEKIPIKKVSDRIVYLKDLAEFKHKEQSPTSYYRINGLNTINIVIYPEKGVNNILLATSIREVVQSISYDLKPGYSILLASDSTEYLSNEIDKIIFRTSLSLFILLVFVFIVNRQFRYVLLIAISIVANLLIACIFFYFLKIELNLYSLAGLTISLGIIIDTSIIMANHILYTGNKKVTLAILASSLTTIAALGVIFFFEEEQRLNLLDFALVIIINLSVSFAIALFLIPALMVKIKIGDSKSKRYNSSKRRIIKFTGLYEKGIISIKRLKWIYVIVFILGFGIPLHWLPEKIEGPYPLDDTYNSTLGSPLFREDIKPVLQKILGGTLRLFSVNVFETSYHPEPGKTMLHVNGSMPEGCTVLQMNESIGQMEKFIKQFAEVELFQASVSSYRNANITIHFKPEYEWSGFPLFLKSELESKAIDLGGADWKVYGVGLGFSNAIYDGYKSNSITLEGYNYDQLYQYAELLRRTLLKNPRIQEVDISSSDVRDRGNVHEFFLQFNNEQLALNGLSPLDFYKTLKDKSYRTELNSVYAEQEMHRVYLTSDTYESFNVWDFHNTPLKVGEKLSKMGRLASIEKRKTGNDINKFDQQYRLSVAFNFVGPFMLAQKVEKEYIEAFRERLPLGYYIQSDQNKGYTVQPSQVKRWNKEDKAQYYLIFLVILAIYFICAVLLESLLQPLAIIAMIPISFIGVFLTFYIYEINFDQGGFASLILLSGLIVNAALYIVNDYNNYSKIGGRKSGMKIYLKAYNHKIIPIILTIFSTVLGLIPFIVMGQKEIFWFAFAAGTIGGLIFSLIAIFIYLPLFLKNLR